MDRPRPSVTRLGVGVDGRPSGRDAIILASLLACSIGAELMLISVFDEPVLATVVPEQMGWASGQSQARAMLTATRDSLAPDARMVVHADAYVWRGLRHVVRREHRDMLVVGSGHRAPNGQVALGERSQELLCHLESPLALAPRGMGERHHPRLDRIGVGFDGEPGSRAAVALAGSIARTAGADLEVRGVVDHSGPGGITADQPLPGGDVIAADKTRSLMREALITAGATGASVQVDVTPGSPVDALLALGNRVDLLVIGSGGPGPAARVSLGRTGSALARGASCPLLIIPTPPDAAAI